MKSTTPSTNQLVKLTIKTVEDNLDELMIAATQKIEIMSSYRDSLLSSMHPPK
jgi:hypothetical protein